MASRPSSNLGYRAGNLLSSDGNARALAAALRAQVTGDVRFDNGSRALYATDASNYRQIPIGVVLPRDVEDVVRTVALCRQYGAPILPRGGGTSLAGQCCNVAVVIDFTKYMHHVLAIEPQRREARVQPGTILDDLRTAAELHHLTFGPDPATHDHCTLGGMIGNNSCGVHSLMAGKTVDNVEEMEILTYDGLRLRVGRTSDDELERIIEAGGRRGQIYVGLKALRDTYANLIRERYPQIPRRVSGYNLDQLLPENGFHVARALVGSEGTCVTVLEATTRLVPSPLARTLLVLGYPDIFAAADQVPMLLEYGPIGLEGLDDRLLDYIRRKALYSQQVAQLPPGNSWLLVEFGGESQQEADVQAQKLMGTLKKQMASPSMQLFNTPEQEKMIWLVRESGLGATAKVPGMADTWEGWEDSAVPPEKEGAYLRDLRTLLDRYGYKTALYGHFGQGCIHARITFDLESRPGIEHYLAFLNDAADLVLSYGGSLSGEHGDGQSRAALLPKMFGDELIGAFREFKALWDPEGKMNPGKVVNAYRPDQNLRLGADFAPWSPRTHFSFPEDGGSFAKAAQRCVGVGACRRTKGGTMCPSYMVTREEADSTRGRARLLFEMLRGDAIGKRGWRDEHVKAALDLCLACKGCKGDCPVNVDMATYKAEFLSHYYAGHVRPRSALAFGRIFYWLRLAAILPGLANLFTQTPGLRSILKAAAGMARQRRIPAFAPQTFRAWFRRNRRPTAAGPRVLLWPDTFNNHFYPDTAKAAVTALEAVGFTVAIPPRWLCCGRPLYDYGMLDLAKTLLRDVISALRDDIRAGTPLVVLEPSCAAVFRDELLRLFPDDDDAKRLCEQTVLLSEFLQKFAPDVPLPQLKRTAIVHGHCHHKAIMKMDAEEAVLTRLGLEYQVLDAGCCGMAGAFGFEGGDHYDLSIKVGERVLLPAVRAAAPSTLIITDGFSCREQIAQTTERRSLHLAEVIQMALQENAGLNVTPGRRPSTHGIGSSARSWAPVGGRETADGDQLAQGKGWANHTTANQPEIIVCDDGPTASRRAADLLVLAAQAAITQNGRFTTALSGGSTPKGLYTLLAQEPYRSRVPWTQVHVFWGDERCVPPDHPDSNYRLAHDALLAHVPIPAGNIHRIAPELRDCKLAAAWYAQELAAFFQLQPGTFPCFDLILLGIGEDGHTASLFPGMSALEERLALAVATPPGRLPPPVDRVTLTLPVLNAAQHVVFLVTGEGKAGVIRQILTNDVSSSSTELLPAQLVRPTDGTVTWILDKGAGQLLG